ncbi:phosphatase PAP2 family protein [Bradymonas sediminis]|uniref:Uncharacterized protein n=1 Tax=Bradymonas sediminis TaxID=1548548 RepID=A0A2Z4FPD9_9DELT|nr:phosphatase PAP2 family protein [Bradymonas sediminis]AWV90596.1 hypothetical protein DN745_15195 [Bradymonas sediminis]TDP62405.1 PAP2 superfamily protein [Bradymonas sediminis]
MRSTQRFGALFSLFICLQLTLLPGQLFGQDLASDSESLAADAVSSEASIPASESEDAQISTRVGPKEDTLPVPTWSSEWGRPGLLGLGVTGLLGASAAVINLAVDPVETPNWRGPILLDGFVHESLRASSPQGRDLAALTSDVLVGSLIAAPLIIEPALLWYKGDDASVATRMTAINMQSMAVAFFATTALKYTVGRARPPLDACWDSPGEDCEDREALSFPSGHTSMAFAGAGLVCLNHEMLNPLGGAWDDIACYTALSAATATGVLRMVAHKHYMSDVLAGAAIGVLSGYVLPKWLYFGFDGESGLLAKHDVMVSPSVGELNGIRVSFTW